MNNLREYLLIINIIAFVLFAVDKYKARRSLWRISERGLFLVCLLGGSIGGLFGIFLLHHKRRKPLFRYGVPVVFLLHIILLIILMKFIGGN